MVDTQTEFQERKVTIDETIAGLTEKVEQAEAKVAELSQDNEEKTKTIDDFTER